MSCENILGSLFFKSIKFLDKTFGLSISKNFEFLVKRLKISLILVKWIFDINL